MGTSRGQGATGRHYKDTNSHALELRAAAATAEGPGGGVCPGLLCHLQMLFYL